MSCPLTGSSQELGIEMSYGILAAFNEYNQKGGVLNSMILELDLRDDGYEIESCQNNTSFFLNDSEIFALIGYVGTSTSESVSDEVIEADIPFIGPLTGSSIFRENFTKQFINIRASYDDELNAMIHYVISKKQKTKVAILYQDDSFGYSGFFSLTRALELYNLDIVSNGTYIRNNVSSVYGSVSTIAGGDPEVIVMIGTYEPLAKFVKLVQNSILYTDPESIYFLTVSSVGTKSFAEYLNIYEAKLDYIIVTEVVPYFEYKDEYPIVEDYENALHSINVTEKSFVSLEGYIVGRFTIAALSSIAGGLTREKFFDVVYEEQQTFLLDGFQIGPYEYDSCNQGLHEVWTVSINENLSFSVIEDIPDPVYFGRSCGFSDVKNMDLSSGLNMGLERKEFQVYEFVDHKLELLVLDDNFVDTQRTDNIEYFFTQNPTGFVALDYAPELDEISTTTTRRRSAEEYFDSVPFIGTISPEIKNYNSMNHINLRPFMYDEVRICLDYFGSPWKSVLVIPETISSEEIEDDYSHQLEIIVVDESETSELYFNDLGDDILDFEPENILIATRSEITSKLLRVNEEENELGLFFEDGINVVFLGLTDLTELRSFAGNHSFYYTSSWDRSKRLYNEFRAEVISNNNDYDYEILYLDYAFYGYLIGLLVSENYISAHQAGNSFRENFFSHEYFMIENDILVGPFQEDCNLGVRELFIYNSESDQVMYHDEYNECTFFVWNKLDLYLVTLPVFGSLIFCSFCIFCCFSLIFWRVYQKFNRGEKAQFHTDCVVIFTDIQSSSLLWSNDPKSMEIALRIHNRTIRNSLKKFGGHEVKFIGDSFMVLFNRVDEAVKCCFDIQESLCDANWPPELLEQYDGRVKSVGGKIIFRGLRVRIAMNFCEKVTPIYDKKKKSFDYIGDDINKCARIEDMTHGGQVCCSAKLVSRLTETEWFDRSKCYLIPIGEFHLKGCGDCSIYEILSSKFRDRVNHYDNVKRKKEVKVEEEDEDGKNGEEMEIEIEDLGESGDEDENSFDRPTSFEDENYLSVKNRVRNRKTSSSEVNLMEKHGSEPNYFDNMNMSFEEQMKSLKPSSAHNEEQLVKTLEEEFAIEHFD